ncbi:hypothetical protein [Actinokineospora sp. UTMC 2448]|uniref:restriction system modified-DNA reader domain-containing protein n=1 Tax=Actinokineospora sp. UTMC 2448 TaxID=2268449 RepID=UPI00216448AA|nr:hypothetical protein [Actinokineospora sp. UTMC 2448]UVS76500.1 hypothetical protein Actkin_00188 [Actinokineospora sp. UTMC 2448]
MPNVPISDEVFKAIQSRAEPLVDTVDTVLRRLLGLQPEPAASKPGGLSALLAAGLLNPNDELVWRRPQLGHLHRATVMANGCIRLENGTVAKTPSGACSELTNTSADGWEEWRRASDDVRLDELRRQAGISVTRRKRKPSS